MPTKDKNKLKEQRRRYQKNRRERDPDYERNKSLKKKYGLSAFQFDELLAAQNNRCALCSTDVPGGVGTFHVDHCHDTGRVRGLLCMDCNTGIGKLKDSPELLSRAIDYLTSDTPLRCL
jgi:hypothetical protein